MKTRRFGRQIPEFVVIGGTFSLSLLFGLPVARRLHLVYPAMNRWVFLVIGFGVGLAILVSLYALLDLALRLLSKKKGE